MSLAVVGVKMKDFATLRPSVWQGLTAPSSTNPGTSVPFFVTKANGARNQSDFGVTITAFYLPQWQEFVVRFVAPFAG